MVNRFVFAMLLVMSVTASAAEDKLVTLKAGQATPVVDLIDRIVDCNHWSGEEPYNVERREEIRKAIAKLRCRSLKVDEEALLMQFRGDDKIRKVIDAAKNLVF